MRLREHHPYQRQGFAHMIAGSQFRYNTAICRVQIDLAVEGVTQQTLFRIEQGRAGLIAGCLNSEYKHAAMVTVPAPGSNSVKRVSRQTRGFTF